MSSQVSALRLFDLIQSHRVTAVIYVAAETWARRAVAGTVRRRLASSQRQPARMNGRSDVCSPRSPPSAYVREPAKSGYALTEVGACLDGEAEPIAQGLGDLRS